MKLKLFIFLLMFLGVYSRPRELTYNEKRKCDEAGTLVNATFEKKNEKREYSCNEFHVSNVPALNKIWFECKFDRNVGLYVWKATASRFEPSGQIYLHNVTCQLKKVCLDPLIPDHMTREVTSRYQLKVSHRSIQEPRSTFYSGDALKYSCKDGFSQESGVDLYSYDYYGDNNKNYDYYGGNDEAPTSPASNTEAQETITCDMDGRWNGFENNELNFGKCKDTNECNTELNTCEHLCVNTNGSYKCACNDGNMLRTDLVSCSDIDECLNNNGRCNQVCINSEGSYSCSCNQGYDLSADGLTCTDNDECANSTHNCEHGCTNNHGSFSCYCHNGYVLDFDESSCEDVDECAEGTSICDQICVNTRGSYTCDCTAGYVLQNDSKTCEDIDECLTNNGGCGQICTNYPGGFTCSCKEGYRLIQHNQCEDIDECLSGHVCAQTCNNTIGSFACGCVEGYNLDINGRSCHDIDDCANITCQNNRSCMDGLSSFSCVCFTAYTGTFCELDINECSFLNGGCSDICVNDLGSFTCTCSGNRTLTADQRSCEGGDFSGTTVFERLRIPRKFLPEGCFAINIDTDRALTSTQPWYCHNYHKDICYTSGVVYIVIKDRSHPVSIQGLAISDKDLLTISNNRYTDKDGSRAGTQTKECKALELSAHDIQNLINEGSFIRRYMSMLYASFPSWINMQVNEPKTLSVQDMRTEFVTGSQITTTQWCAGAPVMQDHLYNIFRFSTDLKIEIYGSYVNIPMPSNGEKFCLIADVNGNDNGTVFLMIPEQLSKIVGDLTYFLKTKHHPTGLGISKDGAIHMNDASLAFWNGYKTFTPSLPHPNLWVGSHTELSMYIIKFEGTENYFKSTSCTETLLASTDPYSSISTLDVTVAPPFDIHVLGDSFKERFEGILSFDIDIYRRQEGINECDETRVPDGFYFSYKTTINPLKNTPVLRHWSPFEDPTNVIDVLIGCKWATPPHLNISSDIASINETINDIIEIEKNLKFSDIPNSFFKKVYSLKSLVDSYTHLSNNASYQRNFLKDVWISYKNIEHEVKLFQDYLEFSSTQTSDLLVSNISENVEKIKQRVDVTMRQLGDQSMSLPKCKSLGFRFMADISAFADNIPLLPLGWFNVEVFYSEDVLQCSRFDAVSKLLEGQASIRAIGKAAISKDIGKFLSVEIGAGIGLAMSSDQYNAVLQFNSFYKILGVGTTVDTFVTFKGMFIYYEANIWNIFYSQVDVEMRMDSSNNLIHDVTGRFVVNKRKKRDTQTRTDSFSDSYLNGLIKVINFLSEEANKRITQVQSSLTDVQNEVSKAQDFVNKMKTELSRAEVIFDKAEQALAVANRRVDETIAPYLRAVEELNQRKIDVDNLCKIQKCSSFCIPGIKCKLCSRKIWFARVYYPCCRLTRCMFKIPDPVCLIRNLACMIIRTIAFAALEAAKIFVRAAIIPFDIAKLALTIAEFAVEKSRLSIEIAQHFLDRAYDGLEIMKLQLETIKIALEAVKYAVKDAADILQFVINHGLKNLADVRDCGYHVEISTRDLPIFDTYCDVNLFRLGWTKVYFPFNFMNPSLSMFHAASATVKTFMKILHHRKKKSIQFEAISKTYRHFRVKHSASDDKDAVYVNETLGFEYNAESDYDYKTNLYVHKCHDLKKIEEFMSTSFENLYTIANESNSIYDIGVELETEISQLDINAFTGNLSFENMGVSREYAKMDYNLTDEEIDAAEEQARLEVMNNSLINEFNNRVNASRANAETELNNIESVDYSSIWFSLMNNFSTQYFPEDTCAGYLDCILHCLSEFYHLYVGENVPHSDMIQDTIMKLDENVTNMFINQNLSIQEMVTTMEYVSTTFKDLMKLHPFCSIPPKFRQDLKNITAIECSKVVFVCDATGDPEPDIWWFKDSIVIEGKHMAYLEISNVSSRDEGIYNCVAGNVVANLSSNEAHLLVLAIKREVSDADNFPSFVFVVIGLAALIFACITICCAVLHIENCRSIRDSQADTKESASVKSVKKATKSNQQYVIQTDNAATPMHDIKDNEIEDIELGQ